MDNNSLKITNCARRETLSFDKPALPKSFSSLNTQLGFTLLELIVTIIIIGVLAVTILPRFTGSDGFEEYSYRTQAIAILRNAQQRAMNQDASACNRILIDSTRLGIPDNANCNGFTSDFGDRDNDFTRLTELNTANSGVTISTTASANTIIFDQMGRPSCGNNCAIQITGDEPLRIVIESQGFIHAD
ncbi:type IV pilin protein [Thalassotalea montiporae]